MTEQDKGRNGRTRKQAKRLRDGIVLPWGRTVSHKAKLNGRAREPLRAIRNDEKKQKCMQKTCIGLKLQPKNPHGKILVLECEGGTDKGEDGHRRDTIPICNALIDLGWCSYPIFYKDVELVNVEAELSRADGVVVRVNPGVYEGVTQGLLDNMLLRLACSGVVTMSHPETMKKMGSKMAIVKLKELPFGLKDTFAYEDFETWRSGFKSTIATGPRVVKQNRGSQGEGIWVCQIKDKRQEALLGDETIIELQEAKDNHKEEMSLGNFIQFCRQYLEGEDGLIVDQPFLPRIVEGEIRINLIHDQAIEIVHKKCVDGGISATLASGAKYERFSPTHPKFAPLVTLLMNNIKLIMPALELEDVPLPLIWSADFILGPKDIKGKDSYYIGEINCSCVGITKQLHLCPQVGQVAVSIVKQRRDELMNAAVVNFLESHVQDGSCLTASGDAGAVPVEDAQVFMDAMQEVSCHVAS